MGKESKLSLLKDQNLPVGCSFLLNSVGPCYYVSVGSTCVSLAGAVRLGDPSVANNPLILDQNKLS